MHKLKTFTDFKFHDIKNHNIVIHAELGIIANEKL